MRSRRIPSMPGGEARRSSLLTLRRLPTGYRVLYTGVLMFFVLGHAAGLLQQQLRSGLSPRGAAEWILGNEADPEPTAFLFARSRAEVLDEVWRRSLADGLPTLVVLALLFRCAAPSAVRGTLASLLLLAALADETGPGLVAIFGASVGVAWWAAQIVLASTIAVAAILCGVEMWMLSDSGRRFGTGVPADR